jgi:hypothetical protein
MSDIEQRWRVLCTDASVILDSIRDTREFDLAIVEEWQRRWRLLAAANEEERERVRREQFRPCEHCQTYDDVLAVRAAHVEQASRGVVSLGWPCCGAPLNFVPLSMR